MQRRLLNIHFITSLVTILMLVLISHTNVEAQDSTGTPATEVPRPEQPKPKPSQPIETAPSQNTATQPATRPTQRATPAVREQPVARPAENRPATPRANTAIEVEEEKEPEWEMDDNNPFELVDYGNARPGSDEPIESPRDTSIHYDNPFELVPNGRVALYAMSDRNSTSSNRKVTKKKSRKKKIPTIFEEKKLNFNAVTKFGFLLIIAIFVAFLNSLYRSDLNKIYRAFTNNNLMMQLYREKGALRQMPYIFLYLLFTFTSGMFIYLLTEYYKITISTNTFSSILACIGGVASFYFFKHLLLKMLGSIFPFKKEIHEYHFTIGIFNQIAGLALIPIVMLMAFAPSYIQIFAIYGAFILIGIILIQRLIRTLFMAEKFIVFHKFHLIVYLCTVEIAPIFIIIKLIMG